MAVSSPAIRFEWGLAGARVLAALSDVLVIVDVLSFTTAVEVAVSRGAVVYPLDARDAHDARDARDARATAFAAGHDAVLAVGRGQTTLERPYSLSPVSLAAIPSGTRLVLPSPNGSAITAAAAGLSSAIVAGCLRNAAAVATAAVARGGNVGVVAAGERWPDGTLRPAFEDLVGAGAILDQFPASSRSPEATAAVAAFRAVAGDLPQQLAACTSGRELAGLGYSGDVHLAAELNCSTTVPVLTEGAYRRR